MYGLCKSKQMKQFDNIDVSMRGLDMVRCCCVNNSLTLVPRRSQAVPGGPVRPYGAEPLCRDYIGYVLVVNRPLHSTNSVRL